MRRASAPAIAIVALAILSPVLWSGWTADDAFYSALNGILGADRLTLAQAMARSFGEWFFGNGRFYPGLILEKYLVFAVFTNVLAYKVLLAALTLASLEAFRRFVLGYAGEACAAVAALSAAALFLVHGYADALIAYNGMPQIIAILLFGSLMAFRSAVRRRSVGFGLTAALLYAAAALTYEDVYLLCVLYPLIALRERPGWRAALAASWPQISLAVLLIAFETWLHARAGLPSDALYALSFAPGPVLTTALYQITAPFPLVYWIAEAPRIASAQIALAILAAAGLFAAVFAMFRTVLQPCVLDDDVRWPWTVGVVLAILPALPVAVLVKYQQELRFGIGYLPVFFQTFGLALLLAGCARALSRRFGRSGGAVAAAAIALFAAAALVGNIGLVLADQPSRNARTAFEDGVARGLFAAVPDGATVTIPKRFAWIDYDSSGPDGISTRGLLYQYAGRRADLEAPDDPRAAFALGYDQAKLAWTVRPLGAVRALVSACNGSALANGDFALGLRCWAAVPQNAARVESEGACFPPELAGKPFAELRVPAGAEAYLAQAFRVRTSAPRIRLRVWSEGAVTVSIGIVYPVGTGIGSERLVDTFVPPQVARSSGACSGLHPVRKSYVVRGFSPGDRIQVRIHAAARGAGGSAAFDGIASLP